MRPASGRAVPARVAPISSGAVELKIEVVPARVIGVPSSTQELPSSLVQNRAVLPLAPLLTSRVARTQVIAPSARGTGAVDVYRIWEASVPLGVVTSCR